jgi:hypothetical protein
MMQRAEEKWSHCLPCYISFFSTTVLLFQLNVVFLLMVNLLFWNVKAESLSAEKLICAAFILIIIRRETKLCQV